jgi:hypothetical protein
MTYRPVAWRKSSQCEAHNCVEVAFGDGRVLVRNSTAQDTMIQFTVSAWRTFCAAVKTGDLQSFS